MSASCSSCSVGCASPELLAHRIRYGVRTPGNEYVVALAGNPNTGKTTVFNALTGLRQHTGNWPGKTVTRAEGRFTYDDIRFKLVDLPGTYSLLASSPDEAIARDFILFGRPDVTVVVVDATALERNLNLVLQVLEITDRVVVCVNLIDEAEGHGIGIDFERLAERLGVPVVATAARSGRGMAELVRTVTAVCDGTRRTQPVSCDYGPELTHAVNQLVPQVADAVPDVVNPRWMALRLLLGDESLRDALTAADSGRVATERIEAVA